MEENLGAKAIELSNNLKCDIRTFAEATAKAMWKRGLLADVKPGWDEIMSWAEKNQRAVKDEIVK